MNAKTKYRPMRLDYAEGPYFQRLANCRESDGVEEFLALAEKHQPRLGARAR